MICIYHCQHHKISCQPCKNKAKEKYLTGEYAKEWLKTLLLTGRDERQAQAELERSVNNMEFLTEKGRQKKFSTK